MATSASSSIEEAPESLLSFAQDKSLGYMGDPEVLAKRIHDEVIGHEEPFKSPYGQKQVLYCDYIASGRSLAFIEDYIRQEVLPLYANTHTTTTITAQQTTSFRNEAREIVRGAVNASADLDAVIFTGSGCTGAIHKLISSLNIDRLEDRPMVLNSGQEHHSNLLPWREIGCEMVVIGETSTGEIDVEDLERKLAEIRKHSKDRMIIGLFSAASNVSGILNDDLLLTTLMHQYGGLAFWDYATAAPYVNIDMNPMVEQDERNLCAKDAIYFSMHKFVGGPQTPGVLIAKKELFRNPVPHLGGGGTVVFVSDKDHSYHSKIEDREEGGTPAIIESIRAGLVFYAKENIGAEYIMAKEEKLMAIVRKRLKLMENLVPLGPMEVTKLPVLSFIIKCPQLIGTGYLHHNFVCFLLNDLFGIQARGGCACAGPYVAHLLGFDDQKMKSFISLIEDPYHTRSHLNPYINVAPFERLKPGFSRLNLPWFSTDEEINFIFDALEIIQSDGWKLLPQYLFNSETGDWQHFSKSAQMDKKWLNDIDTQIYSMGRPKNAPEALQRKPWTEILKDAKQTLANAKSMARRINVPDQRSLFVGTKTGKLRWFPLPYEAKQALLHPATLSNSRKIHAPFAPIPFSTPKNDPLDVGTYNTFFNISPILEKILTNQQSQKYSKLARKLSNGQKQWFQKTFLPNLMGSKTMTMGSKTNLHNPYANHEDCTDDEEQSARSYWSRRHNLAM